MRTVLDLGQELLVTWGCLGGLVQARNTGLSSRIDFDKSSLVHGRRDVQTWWVRASSRRTALFDEIRINAFENGR